MDRGEDMGVIIDDAVPMPSARVARRYPYEDMEVGQSFYISYRDWETDRKSVV